MVKLTAEDARFYTDLYAKCKVAERLIIEAAKKGLDTVTIAVDQEYRVQLAKELRYKKFKVGVIYNGKDKTAELNIAW